MRLRHNRLPRCRENQLLVKVVAHPQTNGRAVGPNISFLFIFPARWAGLGKRLSLRPGESGKRSPISKNASPPSRIKNVGQSTGVKQDLSNLDKSCPTCRRLHRPTWSSANRFGAVSAKLGIAIRGNVQQRRQSLEVVSPKQGSRFLVGLHDLPLVAKTHRTVASHS